MSPVSRHIIKMTNISHLSKIRLGSYCFFPVFTRYLRKWFFPKHHDLQYAGNGNLSMPVHYFDIIKHLIAVTQVVLVIQSVFSSYFMLVLWISLLISKLLSKTVAVVSWTPKFRWNKMLFNRLLLSPPPRTGLLNPLDSPHHMRMDDESNYREGIVLDRPAKQGKGSLVNCGMRKVRMPEDRLLLIKWTLWLEWRRRQYSQDLGRQTLLCLSPQEVRIDKQLQSGLRVTVQLNKTQKQGSFCPLF